MLRKAYVDAADVAILICTGDLAAAESLYESFCKPLCTWEVLWFRDRVQYYCGDAFPRRKPL